MFTSRVVGERFAVSEISMSSCSESPQVRSVQSSTRAPWWTVAAAVGALAVLMVGATVAAILQPRYDWTSRSISDLAGYGATDRWVMTAVFVMMGLCDVLIATGLHTVRLPARLILGAGGIATMLVAVCPVPVAGGSLRHGIVAATASILVAAWPLVAFPPDRELPWWLCPAARSGVVGCQMLLLAIYVVVLQQTGAWSGMVERVAAGAESLWLIAMAAACRISMD